MNDKSAQPTIAFLGLGAMGLPMVKRLVSTGHRLRCFDISQASLRAANDSGATTAESAHEAAIGAHLVILMVATPDQVEEVLFSDHGVGSELEAGQIVCIMGTVGIECVSSVAARLSAKGVSVLDAPVSGGVARAASGELVIMVGGSSEAFQKAQEALASLGDTVVHCGHSVGDGQAVKLVNQLLAGVHIAVAGEALAFAESLGLDPEAVLAVVSKGAAGSFMLSDRGKRMVAREFEIPKSALDIFVKDMNLVLSEARAHRFPAMLAAAASNLYLMGSAKGWGRTDDSSVIRIYEEWLASAGEPR